MHRPNELEKETSGSGPDSEDPILPPKPPEAEHKSDTEGSGTVEVKKEKPSLKLTMIAWNVFRLTQFFRLHRKNDEAVPKIRFYDVRYFFDETLPNATKLDSKVQLSLK